MNMQKGFTLIELMIVVAVMAMLATLVMPSYREYVTRGQLTEAMTQLSSLRVNLEQYYQDNRDYGTGGCGIGMPNGKYFTFACNLGATNQSFTITATGKIGGNTDGFSYTVDQNNSKSTTNVPSSDWGSSGTGCWIIKKGGMC